MKEKRHYIYEDTNSCNGMCEERGKAMDFTPHEFAELYGTIYTELYRYALYALGDEEDAKDAVSDAVLDGFRQRQSLRDRSAFKQWMFAILANKCRRKKKEYAERRANEHTMQSDTEEEVWDVADERTPDVPENLWVRQMFAKLGEEEQEILSLRLFAGYTSREIGLLLGQPPGTIRSKEHRALEKLRKEMTADGKR